MAGDEGKEAATFMKNIGQYFNDGFAATDYATAQSMFLDGKSAMYYIGDWEIAAMQDAYKAGKIDYFYLPTIENGKTDASEFCVNSGIEWHSMQKHLMQKPETLYFTCALDNYGEKYAAKQQMSPIKTELPSDVEFSDLYLRILMIWIKQICAVPETMGYISGCRMLIQLCRIIYCFLHPGICQLMISAN